METENEDLSRKIESISMPDLESPKHKARLKAALMDSEQFQEKRQFFWFGKLAMVGLSGVFVLFVYFGSEALFLRVLDLNNVAGPEKKAKLPPGYSDQPEASPSSIGSGSRDAMPAASGSAEVKTDYPVASKMPDTLPSSSPVSRIENSQIAGNASLDWQTYKADIYGFELKYPKNYSVITKGISSPASSLENAKMENSFEAVFIDSGKAGNYDSAVRTSDKSIIVTVYNNEKKYTLEQWLNKYREISPTESGLSFGISRDTQREITIDGVKGLKGDFGCCMNYQHSVFVKNGTRIYQIAGGFLDFETRVYPDEELFGQVLSTFKFTK